MNRKGIELLIKISIVIHNQHKQERRQKVEKSKTKKTNDFNLKVMYSTKTLLRLGMSDINGTEDFTLIQSPDY